MDTGGRSDFSWSTDECQITNSNSQESGALYLVPVGLCEMLQALMSADEYALCRQMPCAV